MEGHDDGQQGLRTKGRPQEALVLLHRHRHILEQCRGRLHKVVLAAVWTCAASASTVRPLLFAPRPKLTHMTLHKLGAKQAST